MAALRLVATFLLCALAAGQQEQKTIADFKKPFRVVANLIVDANFFLLRELTAEELQTGEVDLADPFDEKNRPRTTTTTTTTTNTTTTTRRPRPASRFAQDISGLLPPPPSATAAPAFPASPARSPTSPVRSPTSGSRRFFPRKPESAVSEQREAVSTPSKPLRRGGVRRKVVRLPARRRVITNTEAPAAKKPTIAEEPTTTTTTTITRRPAISRQPAVAAPARVPALLPARAPAPLPTRAPALLPARAPALLPAQAPAPLPAHAPARFPAPVAVQRAPTRFDAAAAAVARIPGTSRRVLPVETEGENEINSLHRRLPSGSQTVVSDMSSSDFSCNDRPYGYYADMKADCQVFHICTPIVHPDGFEQNLRHSLFCNNGTRFDQRTLTCRDEALALPCADSGNYYTSIKFFEKFDIFERARAEDEKRRSKILSRLDTLEDVEALEAQLDQ